MTNGKLHFLGSVLFLKFILAFAGCASLVKNPTGKTPIGSGYILTESELDRQMTLSRHGDGEACYKLHLHYSLGLHIDNEGFAWEKKSAEYGYPLGMYSYGIALWNTATSRSQKVEAKRWITKAASAGDANAKDFLTRY